MATKKVVKKEEVKAPVANAVDAVYQVVVEGRVVREYTGTDAEKNAKSFAEKTGASYRKA